MFKLIILEKGIEILAVWLQNPKRDKVRELLTSERMQNTIAGIFAAYSALVDEIEEEA